MEPTSKERMLKSIRKALIQPTDLPFPNLDHVSTIYREPGETLDITFAQEFTKVNGQFVYCENDMDLVQNLNTVAERNGWNHLYAWEYHLQEFFQKHEFRRLRVGHSLEKADVGITTCECLIARTGTVLLTSRKESGRALPVFPPVHWVIAYSNQLYYDMKDAFQHVLEKYEGNLPSMISLATGPSRTADIEKTLVLGAHGPKEVFVFFVDQPAS